MMAPRWSNARLGSNLGSYAAPFSEGLETARHLGMVVELENYSSWQTIVTNDEIQKMNKQIYTIINKNNLSWWW